MELDCIPAGMEMFPAANEDQWSLIKKVIEESDYYLVVVGGRYGSLSTEGVSYTEKEYKYAEEIKKPIIGFLHKDPAKIPVEKSDMDAAIRKKLQEFRVLVEKKVVKYWASPAELGSVVSRSIVQLMKAYPAIGWVRGDQLPSDANINEILRLRGLVDELERKIHESRTTPPPGTDGLSQGDDIFEMRFEFRMSGSTSEEYHPFKATWSHLFSAIAPHIMNEAPDHVVKRALTDFISMRLSMNPTWIEFVRGRPFRSLPVISDEDYQTIKVQLRALGLIEMSIKNRAIRDQLTYWKLTPYGDGIMNQLRAVTRRTDQQAEEEIA